MVMYIFMVLCKWLLGYSSYILINSLNEILLLFLHRMVDKFVSEASKQLTENCHMKHMLNKIFRSFLVRFFGLPVSSKDINCYISKRIEEQERTLEQKLHHQSLLTKVNGKWSLRNSKYLSTVLKNRRSLIIANTVAICRHPMTTFIAK